MSDVKQVEGTSDVDNLLAGFGLMHVRELDDFLARRQKLRNAWKRRRTMNKLDRLPAIKKYLEQNVK